ncbi:MAG: hypothetical protein HYS45_02085 [Parcubacteria group bacterium]|nr:hypothetical protein [Parcubacteria group bacterium]MBI2637248.1 hypothetical protein [Parcubacteria group bacterium]
MISYIAHIPHSPLLLPQISRGKFRQFKKMSQTVAGIGHDIYSRGCDTLILLSPYASPHEAHLLNVSPQFTVSFGAYGEFLTRVRFHGELALAYRIRHGLGDEYPIVSITRPELDGATGAAALALGVPEGRVRLLPIYHAQSPTQYLLEFGKKLRDILERTAEKIAIVSLGDMSRTSKRNREAGRRLDQSMLKKLSDRDTAELLATGPDQIDGFSLGCIRPLAVTLGVLSGQSYAPEVLNYEQKYGVGMLAARFI